MIRILFFIGSLKLGGKERRLIELLTYLKDLNSFDLMVVLAYNQIDYPTFYKLGINYISLNKKPGHKDARLFFELNKICGNFKPGIIHTWGSMQTFYMVPISFLRHIPLINSQITDAPPKLNKLSFFYLQNLISFKFSTVILANSYAGLVAYNVNKLVKSKVIYNGVNQCRFENLLDKNSVKQKYGINTHYTVIMAASFTINKDYRTFLKVAEGITTLRDDISFVAVGSIENQKEEFKQLQEKYGNNKNILLLGEISEVESLINACEIGMLLSNKLVHGEGISNAIIEYMALRKPVIANDSGGTNEIIEDGINGYLVASESVDEIANMVVKLIDHKEERELMGSNGRKKVENVFTLEKMGQAFIDIYESQIKLR